jgi:glutamate-5-semialdehyde dehydrogenase
LTSARDAFRAAPSVGDPAYEKYCGALAELLARAWPEVRKANEEDIATAEQRGLPPVLVERLRLTDDHLGQLVAMAAAVPGELRAATATEQGTAVASWGVLRRVPKPLGVALMIYEARPTVTVEGALLFAAVGNAVLLRGGKEIAATNAVLGAVIRDALTAAGLPAELVTVLDDPNRAVLRALLKRPDAIDVLVPRGSPSLIDFCRTASGIPLLASGGGVNHLYVHRSADPSAAVSIALDSKIPAPAGCTSLEVALVDAEVSEAFVDGLIDQAARDGSALTLRLSESFAAPQRVRRGPRRRRWAMPG